MEEYLKYAGILVLILAAAVVILIYNNRKRRKLFLSRMRRQWGKVSERAYTLEEIDNISHYASRLKEDAPFFVDDITWNDLNMDRVFVGINQTVSSPGEDYLYYLLRTPRLSEEELEKQERRISFFAEHPREREEMQMLLSEVGKGRYGSVSDAIFVLEDAPVLRRTFHIVSALAVLAVFVYMLFQPVPGIFLFILLCTVNAGTYFGGSDRKVAGVYLYCFENLLRMLAAAKKMEKITWEEVQEQTESIRGARLQFGKFQRGSFWVTGRNDSSGNPIYLLMDYLRMIAHVDLIKYNAMLREVVSHREAVLTLLNQMGMLDAAIAIASWRQTLPYYCHPKFQHGSCAVLKQPGQVSFRVQDMYHPLISDPVANSITAKRGVLVTGSNASGKSTFIKNVAINAILAQSVNTCLASSYEAPMFRILTSMALRDDLYKGESYFIVEIKSLKRILDQAEEGMPVLCIVDEVLRGTNTIERIAASSRILKQLAAPNVICFAATHDIELSYILEKYYDNYHFEEEIRQQDILFSYLLQKGRASTRNAISLLQLLGYPQEIVDDAREAAEVFEENGVWENL